MILPVRGAKFAKLIYPQRFRIFFEYGDIKGLFEFYCDFWSSKDILNLIF